MKQVTFIPIYLCTLCNEFNAKLYDNEHDSRVLIPEDKILSIVNLGWIVNILCVYRVGVPLRVYRKYVTSLCLIESEVRLPNYKIMSSYE